MRLLCSLLLLLVNVACFDMIGEPIAEAQARDSGSEIAREDAAKLVGLDFAALAMRCPDYVEETSSRTPGIVLATSGGCGSGHPWVGCTRHRFLDRTTVELCRLWIQTDPCHPVTRDAEGDIVPNDDNSAHRALTLAVCISAFRGEPGLLVGI